MEWGLGNRAREMRGWMGKERPGAEDGGPAAPGRVGYEIRLEI